MPHDTKTQLQVCMIHWTFEYVEFTDSCYMAMVENVAAKCCSEMNTAKITNTCKHMGARAHDVIIRLALRQICGESIA